MGPHIGKGVKHDIHIKLKSYKFELLGELDVLTWYHIEVWQGV